MFREFFSHLFCTRSLMRVNTAQSFIRGVSPEKGTGATISDDNDDQLYSDTNIFDGSFDEQQTRAETKLPRAALL
ncbi:homeobox protein knotted-1-like 5 isoform X3 [Camellia sinensis]|uniref:homeobox protein knotted-1-like 5 isoform X3 n=1 Tax=Camellia sinensis TaxID=4442 RepID=UPI00103634E2|nr:homeobox protein knotted-1-like 5 isoform X3 [Camellia sinensis]